MLSPGETEEGGGAAPLAPPGYFRQDEGGAVPAAPLLLRGVLLLAALWLAVRLLPGLPDLAAVLLVAGLAALIALPWAWGLAVRRGFDLGTYTARGRLRPLLAGPVLRVVLSGFFSAGAAALLLLRLVEAGPVLWGLAALALPLAWALMVLLAPWGRTEQVGLHARRLVQLWSTALTVAALVILSALLGALAPMPAPPPFEAPVAAGPLVAEALAFARLWAGLEAYALGQAEAFGAWGRGLALLLLVAGQAAVFGAMATVALALALPWHAWRRAIGPASDAAAPPPVGRLGPVAAGALALLLAAAALSGSHWLAAQPPEARPAAQVMDLAERIDGQLHRPGTTQALVALRSEGLAETEAVAAGAEALINQGFDTMLANVDGFLDGYYSLWAEYARLGAAVTGSLERRLNRQISEALLDGAPFAPLEALQVQAQARLMELAGRETALLAESRLEPGNPALVRILPGAEAAGLPPLSELLANEQRAAVTRFTAAGGVGAVSAVVARQLVARLAGRQAGSTAMRLVTRAGGPLVALGVDYGLLQLDAYRNRDAFRDEIVAQIEAQRRAALQALSP